MKIMDFKESLLYEKISKVKVIFLIFFVAIILFVLLFLYPTDQSVSLLGQVSCEEQCMMHVQVQETFIPTILDHGKHVLFLDKTYEMKVASVKSVFSDETNVSTFYDIAFIIPKEIYDANRVYRFVILLDKEPLIQQIFHNYS